MLRIISNTLIDKIREMFGGNIINIENVSGGLVHYTYLVVIEKGEQFILKIRGDSFKENSDLYLAPNDIEFEAEVMKLLNQLMPGCVPELINFFMEENAILMSNIGGQESNFVQLMQNGKLSLKDYYNIGKQTGDFCGRINKEHFKLKCDKTAVNFEDNLTFRLNRHNLPYLSELVKTVKAANKFNIFGDLSPKNIFYIDGKVKICDFDNFQTGPLELDKYYLLAHIIINNLSNALLVDIVNNFLLGFAESDIKDQLSWEMIFKYILSIIIYRFDNNAIKYDCSKSVEDRYELAQKIYYAFYTDKNFDDMGQLIFYLTSDKVNEIEAKILEVNYKIIIDKLESNNSVLILDDTTTIESYETPHKAPELSGDEELDEMVKHLSLITKGFTVSLDAAGAYLRIRRQKGVYEFTLKYKIGGEDPNLKIEKEINVKINDSDKLLKVKKWLSDNGFTIVSNEIKDRKSYISRLYGTRIDIDSWLKPLIATYIEIEGFDRQSIEETAYSLGYAKESLSSITGKELFKKYNVKRGL
ncbi:MAG: hypothetical protein NTZ42_04810 [Candidatus Gribaldobacteria bacterium]|nr:hypothetical protein [Candidatus Gribaldobacteria bacterium]